MATNKKGKTSKSAKKKVVVDYVKKERNKKEYIFIEQTIDNLDKIYAVEKEDGKFYNYYEQKPVVSLVTKFGKKYFKIRNTVEEEISSI